MNRRHALCAIIALVVATLHSPGSTAQSSCKVTVIGLLDAGERLEWWDAFRRQMRELGYVDGRNVTFVQLRERQC
jgi:hypothetical protein